MSNQQAKQMQWVVLIVAVASTAVVASIAGVVGGYWLLERSDPEPDLVETAQELQSATTIETPFSAEKSSSEEADKAAEVSNASTDTGAVASLRANLVSGQLTLGGDLPDLELVTSIRETAAIVYGPGVVDELTVDPTLADPGWAPVAANLVASLPLISNGGFELDGGVVNLFGVSGSVGGVQVFQGAVAQILGPDIELTNEVEVDERDPPRLFIRKNSTNTIEVSGVVPSERMGATIEQTLASVYAEHVINTDFAVDPTVEETFALHSLPRFAGLFFQFPVWEVIYVNETFESSSSGAASFDSDSAELPAVGIQILDSFAAGMTGVPGLTLTVEGHTDGAGDATYNLELSERRAQAVVDYLVSAHGIDPSRLTAIGYGEERPVADNAIADGRTQNRRVDFLIGLPGS